MAQDIYDGRVAGVGSTRTAAFRLPLIANEKYLPGNFVIAGSLTRYAASSTNVAELPAGLLMMRTTTTNKYRNWVVGATTAAVNTGTITTLTVGAATATELARLIAVAAGNITCYILGPSITNGSVNQQQITVTAASGTTATISSTVLSNYVSGSLIVNADGTAASVPETFLPNGYPIKVVDEDNASRDMDFGRLPIAGTVDSSTLLPWPSDTAIQSFILARLNTTGKALFQFDNTYGL